jgi:hypothetical protein
MSRFGRLVDPPGFGSNRAGRQNATEILPGIFAGGGGGGGGGRAKTGNSERRAASAAANQNIATRG